MALYTEVNWQTFVMINGKPFVVTTSKKFYSKMIVLKTRYFHFPIVKMAANYPEIGRVGKLEAGFQQVPLVPIF